MATTEPLYRLDLVIDKKKPSWSWLQEMAALYRSAIINSNGKFKIISERDDLPIRQVFHSGNIIRERTEIRVGGDPMQINQITGQFSNKNIDYERDILIIQDSQSVLIDNNPIKPFDLDLTGISRKTEVNRRLSVEMQRRKEIKTEMTFFTNVEGINVEPGDVCIAGIIMTDFEMGYGGRANGGSTAQLIADKPIALSSGTNYDLWVWHVAADTPELRTVTGPLDAVVVEPTSAFNHAVEANDRYAIGVQSEDLVRLLVKKVVHNEDGLTQITGEQFVNVGFLLDCPSSLGSFADYYNMPTNPWSISYAQSNCEVCFQLKFTAPSCVGGSLLKQVAATPYRNNAFLTVFPTTTNLPPLVADIQVSLFTGSAARPGFFNQFGLTAENTITFISGPNSGLSRRIISYPTWVDSVVSGAIQGGEYVMMLSPLPNIATSGDQYYINFDQGSNFAGMRLRYWTGSYQAFAFADSVNITPTITGNSGCFDLASGGDSLWAILDLVSSIGALSAYGGDDEHSHTFQFNMPGCFAQDERLGFIANSITTQSLTNLLAMYLPASELSADAYFEIRARGLFKDVCVSGETTRVSFGVSYAGTTRINSHVITIRDANSPGLAIGSDTPFTLTSQVRLHTVPTSHVRISYQFDGQLIDNSIVSTNFLSAPISVAFLQVQSFMFTALVSHLDTTGAVHSHGCFSVALDHGEFEIIDTADD